MSKPDVLDRVSADLAFGHTQPAIQRLSSLVAADPTDLDLRRRLARLHRMVGNRIEAGRWDYLTPGAGAAEVAAFERAFPSPSSRLAALRWPQPRSPQPLSPQPLSPQPLSPQPRSPQRSEVRDAADGQGTDPGRTAGGYARARLEMLARAATAEPTRGATKPAWSGGGRWSPRVVALAIAGLAAAFFVVLGAVTVVQWLLR
jgi:hypothetical protein